MNELKYFGDPIVDTGLTIVARVYDATGTQVGIDVTTTEVGVLAIYMGDMPTAVAGTYAVMFFESTTLKAQGVIEWDGTVEVTLQTLNAQIETSKTEIEISVEDAALIAR